MFWEWPNPDLYLKVWTGSGNKNWISTLWPSPLFLFLSSSISWWRPPSIWECWSCSQAKMRSSFRILQHSENWILWRARDFFFLGGGPAAMAKLQLQNSATFSKLDTIAYSGFFFFGGGSSFIIMKILQTHKMYVSNGVLSRAQDFSRGNPCKSCMSKMFAKSRNS